MKPMRMSEARANAVSSITAVTKYKKVRNMWRRPALFALALTPRNFGGSGGQKGGRADELCVVRWNGRQYRRGRAVR